MYVYTNIYTYYIYMYVYITCIYTPHIELRRHPVSKPEVNHPQDSTAGNPYGRRVVATDRPILGGQEWLILGGQELANFFSGQF